MKRLLFLLFFVICLIAVVAVIVVSNFDFETMEGRGADKKENVNWVFENAKFMNGISDYLVLQSFDSIRQEPSLNVSVSYWIKKGGYIDHYAVEKADFSGVDCLRVNVENFKLKCSINETEPFNVCESSFFVKSNLISAKPSLQDLIDNYDAVIDFYKSFPSTQIQAHIYAGENIPFPLRPHGQVVDNSTVKCWKEFNRKNINKPNVFNCSDEFHRCESSASIKVLAK